MKRLYYKVTLTFAKDKDLVKTEEVLRSAIESSIKSTVLAALRTELPAVKVETTTEQVNL